MCRGIPSEESIKQTGCSVLNFIIDTFHIPPNRIILYYIRVSYQYRYGHSLGSAISVFLSVYIYKTREQGVAGVILQVYVSIEILIL